jgi:hypothetical protein
MRNRFARTVAAAMLGVATAAQAQGNGTPGVTAVSTPVAPSSSIEGTWVWVSFVCANADNTVTLTLNRPHYAGSRLSGLFTSKQGRQQQAVFSKEK